MNTIRIKVIQDQDDFNSYQLLTTALRTGLTMAELERTMERIMSAAQRGTDPRRLAGYGMGGDDIYTQTHHMFCSGIDIRNRSVTFDIHC